MLGTYFMPNELFGVEGQVRHYPPSLFSLSLSSALSLFFLLSVSFLLSSLSHSIAMFCVCVFPASLSLSLSFSPLNFTFYILLLLTFVFHNFAGRSRVGRH